MLKPVIVAFVIIIALVKAERVRSATECIISNADNVLKFNPETCSSAKITGIVADLDGNLRFGGLSENNTAGLYARILVHYLKKVLPNFEVN